MSQNQSLKDRTLRLLQDEARPLSAYDLIDLLREPNQRLAPTTIYRVLNRLVEENAIHKIEAKNSFMACQHSGHEQPALVAHCDNCGTVEEVVDSTLADRIINIAKESMFSPNRTVIELHGSCKECSKGG